jgi:hypothetical protein
VIRSQPLSRGRCDHLSEPRQADTTLAEMRHWRQWDCQLTCRGSELSGGAGRRLFSSVHFSSVHFRGRPLAGMED